MSNTQTDASAIASRYATAIFALAAEGASEAATVEEFQVLGRAVSENSNLYRALANPLIHRREKSAILEALGRSASPLTQRALATIAKGGRGDILPAIAADLQVRLTRQRGALAAVVTSARPLSAAIQKQLSDALAAATGKAVQLQLREDAALLGGLSIQLGSMRLDATLAGALTTMRSELIAAAQRI